MTGPRTREPQAMAEHRRRDNESNQSAELSLTAQLLSLQRQIGNAQVARMLARREAHGKEQEPSQAKSNVALAPINRDAGSQFASEVNSHGLVVQRRNGFRPPPRRPPRRPGQGSRGRFGQLEGQRLPRNSAARRAAFERRERERVDAARRRFEDEVKRSQAFLERWGKEGSEPKTAAEKAMRVLIKMLEFFDELSTSWNETHESFNSLLIKRINLKLEDVGNKRHLRLIDTEILRLHKDLQSFDKDFVGTMLDWQTGLDTLVVDFDWKSPGSVVNTVLSMIRLVGGALTTASKLKERVSKIGVTVLQLDMQIHMMRPMILHSPSATMREAD